MLMVSAHERVSGGEFSLKEARECAILPNDGGMKERPESRPWSVTACGPDTLRREESLFRRLLPEGAGG